MTVAVYVAGEKDAATLIPWGIRFARADHTDLLVISVRRSKDKVSWKELELSSESENSRQATLYSLVTGQSQDEIVLKQDIAAGVASSDLDRVAIEVVEFQAPVPEQAIIEALNERHKITFLLLRLSDPTRKRKRETSGARYLFDHAPCEACLITGQPPESTKPIRILLATHGGSNISTELIRSRQLAQAYKGKVTVLYIRPDDDLVAEQVARKNLEQLIRDVPGPYQLFEQEIALQDSLLQGINLQPVNEFDLIVIGSNRAKVIRQTCYGLIAHQDKPFPVALATMRQGIPFATRLWTDFTAWCRTKIPQLGRERRVELVDRLQTNSRFDFDFVSLISLSTLIAGLGLIRNSGAVVIGAMLVAPLMTPLVGIGFALLQGNLNLIKNALRSVLLGFAVAFLIGVVLGLVVPSANYIQEGQLNSELLGRCEPNLIDLVIALVSGIAGAYATGRPNLVGALPGVAIAAALVPPIATAGVVLAAGEPVLSAGALLLFFVNIIAIVLGTTVAFWAIGINAISPRTDGRKQDAWPQYWFIAFVIIAFVLAVFLPTQSSPVERHMQATDQAPSNPAK